MLHVYLCEMDKFLSMMRTHLFVKGKERNRLPAHVTNVGMPMVKYPQRRISSSIAVLSFTGIKNNENDWKKTSLQEHPVFLALVLFCFVLFFFA